MTDVLDIPGGPDAAYRLFIEVWLEASSSYWRRRAEQLELAKPRRSDFTGRASLQDLADACDRLDQAATACRARAQLADASRLELDHTLRDIATGSRWQLDEAETALRRAIDAGDRDTIARLEAVVDALDHPAHPTPAATRPTRRADAA